VFSALRCSKLLLLLASSLLFLLSPSTAAAEDDGSGEAVAGDETSPEADSDSADDQSQTSSEDADEQAPLSPEQPAVSGEGTSAANSSPTEQAAEAVSVESVDDALLPGTPAVPELSGVSDVPEAPLVGAVAEVRSALVRVDALRDLLMEDSLAEERESALVELSALRRSLEDSLLQLGREQERADLAAWLRSEGLLLVAASELAEESSAEVTEIEPVEEPSGPQGISPEELKALVTEVEGAPFKDGKMAALTGFLERRYVMTVQAAQLVDLFSFSRDKVDTLVFLYPRILDSEQFESLLESLKFASDRMAVRRELGLEGS